ncbi:MAG: adenylosuccinate synthase [Chloroflexi bacterium]|nr:MAG: adenylosuccinate synthase [Chloroflexota bacterium]
MSIEIVVGINWGDEGKGRMVDYLAQDADYVVRYQGGNNAGHTVVNEQGVFKLHLIPSGIFNPNTTNVLGPGTVIDLAALDQEIRDLSESGIDTSNIKVSDRATICFPFHAMEDTWEEERLSDNGQTPYGSTRRGIAPVYGDRVIKKGIQLGELCFPDYLRTRVEKLVAWKRQVARDLYKQEPPFTFEAIWQWLNTYGNPIKDRICDTTVLLEQAAQENKKILCEAQLGALRDVQYGIYPYTTSSCSLSAFASIGSGLFGYAPTSVIGVMKAFSTCVGEGPFVTEILDQAQAGALRETAHEYGAATGRPRRIGHFDALASTYGVQVQAVTEVAITKLDTLTGRDTLLICTHYEYQGKPVYRFPITAMLEHCRPVYKAMPGWQEDISNVRHFQNLPPAAQAYVLEIEHLIGRPIRYVSVGARREALIDRSKT